MKLILTVIIIVTLLSNASQLSSTIFKLSVYHRRTVTGHWVAQVQLNHESLHTEEGPWHADIEHKTTNKKDSDDITIIASVKVPPKRPSSDYEHVPGLGYYKLHNTGKNFQDACDTCSSEGAHLVIINSETEFNAIRNINKYSWVGVHDIKVTGDFKTIFYDSLNSTGYIKWHPTEPNHNGHCVVVENSGHYHDTGCNSSYAFVCEQEL